MTSNTLSDANSNFTERKDQVSLKILYLGWIFWDVSAAIFILMFSSEKCIVGEQSTEEIYKENKSKEYLKEEMKMK